jgi:acyl carrier protein
MRNNGGRVNVKVRTEHTFDSLKNYLLNLEQGGNIIGFSDHIEAAKDWLRCNLVNLVFRGNVVKEKISSLRPVHLESYRIRNIAQTRDYNSADQVYLMLRKKPDILESLKEYLSKGWDNATKDFSKNQQLDVDSAGILQLIKNIKVDFKTSNQVKNIRPLLENQADLFCDDILRLLVYKDSIPRSVFIEYLRTLIGFHLSLYTQKIIHLLPKMVGLGTRNVEDDFSVIVDVTDNFESRVSRFACEDMEKTINGLYGFFKATFEINAVHKRMEFVSQNLDSVDDILSFLINRPANFDVFYENKLVAILERFKDDEDDDKKNLLESIQFEESNFNKYIQTLLKAKGAYQYRYYQQFLDAVSMKNTDYGFLADGRSRKHPRRAVLGSRLLETLVQLLVLDPKEGGGFKSRALSIDELISKLRSRYGIIINGLNEPRFAEGDMETHLAFNENVDAFKNKLRQIGFYTDLSDAYILQKIRPRYKFHA